MIKNTHGITILQEYIFNTYLFSNTAINETLIPPFMAAYEIIKAQFLGDPPIAIVKVPQEYQSQLIRTERHALLIDTQQWEIPNIEKSTFLIPHHKWDEIPTNDVFLVNDKFIESVKPSTDIIPNNIEKLLDTETLDRIYQTEGLLFGAIIQKLS